VSSGDGADDGKGVFTGRQHPTFFRFHRRREGEVLARNCELGRRCRIKFETDVVNDYFSRPLTPGRYHVEVLEGPLEGVPVDHSLTLYNGIANWSINLPEDRLAAHDELTVECMVTDDTLVEPLVNIARLALIPKAEHEPPSTGTRQGRSGSSSKGTTGGPGNSDTSGLAMPTVVKVRESDANWGRYKFDERTACRIVEEAASEDQDESAFTFYVNVDNLSLRTDMKAGSEDVALVEAKFVYGNVLVGLALIHEHRCSGKPLIAIPSEDGEDTVSIQAVVDGTTRALAPFLVPMIDYLGALSADEVTGLAKVGDEE
jgi:hypothetical protein